MIIDVSEINSSYTVFCIAKLISKITFKFKLFYDFYKLNNNY